MKKIKSLNILLVIVTFVMVINITVPLIANAQQSEVLKSAPESSQTEQSNKTTTNTNNEEAQDFSSGIQAMTYAQKKLDERVNFSTNINAQISMNVSIFKFNVELKSKTIVNSDGVVYTCDACNMYEKWLNGQKGFEYYSKRGSNTVYNRETMDVTYDTCVANFKGNYRVISLTDALNEFGYIDNSKLLQINANTVTKEESFTKTEDGYEMSFRINKDGADEARQKFLRCSELVRKPSVTKLIVSYKMDLYGNINSVHYSLSAYGTKKLDGIGEFSAPIDIEIEQTYSYSDQNLLIPTVIEF